MPDDDLELADVIDLELQLLRDRDLPRETLRRRDRLIGVAIAAGAGPRRGMLRAWVRELHRREGRESLGARIAGAVQALEWVLVLVGLTGGAGTAAAVLAYDGRHPVNVVHFLAVFVGLQIILLLLFLFSSALWRVRARIPVVGGAYGLARLLVNLAVGLVSRRVTAEQRALLDAARGRLGATQQIYGAVERWLLVGLVQRFGLWFNLGALVTCLYLVAFSDLAFGWQTTLDWSPEGFHRVVSALAAPWSWIDPTGVPSLDVVRQSRTFRLDGAARLARPELLAQWWRFLVVSLLVYGLVPRLVVFTVARARLRRALARLRFDHADFDALAWRLTSPLVDTQAPVAELPPLPERTEWPARAAPPLASEAAVVIWGDVPIARADLDGLLAQRFGWRVAAVAQAGVDEVKKDAGAILAITSTPSRAPLVVLAESFEAPTRETKSFVQSLRQAAGPSRAIVVALVDGDGAGGWAPPTGDDLRVWDKHMTALGDPYLRVEPLLEGP